MIDGRLGKRGRRDSRDPENGAQTSHGRRCRRPFGAAVARCRRRGRNFSARSGTEAVDELVVVGQCGQSLDAPHRDPHRTFAIHQRRGRARPSASACARWSTRSWSASAPRSADDPQLTVRRVAGPSPARVVIDPSGRLPPGATRAGRRRRPPPRDHRHGRAGHLPVGRRARSPSPARRAACAARRSSRRLPPAACAAC